MAEQNVTPVSRADEIAALRQQLEEMQKRLEELSAADAKVQDASSAALVSEAEAAPLQSEDNAAAVCAGAAEVCGGDADSVALSDNADSLAQPAEAAAQINSSVNSDEVQKSQPSVSNQSSEESVEYEPYAPSSSPVHHPNVEAAPDISTSSSVYKQQAKSAAQRAVFQKPNEAQSGYTYQAAYSQQQSAQTQQAPQAQAQSAAQEQAQAQQTSQAQNPYGGTYAGQQVPFGQTEPQQQYYQQTQQTYYGYGVQQNNAYQSPLVCSKDHVAAALLGIFLGAFGVHKFYLGYHTVGFFMLGMLILGSIITVGLAACVMWLIGVIEGVIYLVKDQAEFEQIYVFNKREWF